MMITESKAMTTSTSINEKAGRARPGGGLGNLESEWERRRMVKVGFAEAIDKPPAGRTSGC